MAGETAGGTRELDLVVFGATGVTGRQVAAYVAERARQTGTRWAAAGRTPQKVEQVLRECGVEAPEVIAADVADPPTLTAMAARARVVLNLVGPYTLHGWPVIEACVAEGAHYADLSGEIPYVRRVIDAFHEPAIAAGVKLVQLCGFESVPADLAVRLAIEAGLERWGRQPTQVDVLLTLEAPPRIRPSDGGGAGSFQSLVAAMTDDESSVLSDPAALVSDPDLAEAIRERSPISVRVRRAEHGAVVAPMVPFAFIAPALIHRTGALLAAEGVAGSEPFRYREGFLVPGSRWSLPLRYGAAGALSATNAMAARLARGTRSTRERAGRVLTRLARSDGKSPPLERQALWRWGLTVDARVEGSEPLRVQVESEGHIGYMATGRIMGEAGLLLSEPGATPERAGCLTPVTALGLESIERFKHAKLRMALVA